MIKQFVYQQTAIQDIKDMAIKFLHQKGSKTIVFQAPTGSGKTVMMAKVMEYISDEIESHNDEVCFVRISVNALHEQSKESLEEIFEMQRKINCLSIHDVIDRELYPNQALFINREKINKKDNLFVKENERDRNIQSIIRNTKDNQTKIVLIIDESHRNAKTEKSQELIDMINPDLTIEVSATPKNTPSDYRVIIPKEEVIAEGMIKKDIIINPSIATIKTNTDLIELTLRKRKMLKKLYKKNGSRINPLVLIQVPNKQVGSSIQPEEQMIQIVESLGVTRGAGTLAIKVADKDATTNREDIEQLDSPVEVLIFKQAVALGRDCPRAHILVLQREWKEDSYEFNMQTLGRIMRMPEHKHYDHDELNSGYVYTATENFSIVADFAKDYASEVVMKRNDNLYQEIVLPSENPRRKREITRLGGEFRSLFMQAVGLNITPSINTALVTHYTDVGGDGVIAELDKNQHIEFTTQGKIIKDEEQLCREYTQFLANLTAPFAKSDSTSTLKGTLYSFFKYTLGITNEDHIANIVLKPNNKDRFVHKIEEAKVMYQNLPPKSDEIIPNTTRQIPKTILIQTDYEEFAVKKSIMQPFYIKKNKNDTTILSGPEELFIDTVLEKSSDYLLWWYKNGERDTKFFGMCYQGNPNDPASIDGFYPDFILQTKKEIIIIEIKDDKAYNNPTNCIKYTRGKKYQSDQQAQGNNVFFCMLSPKDFGRFLKHLDAMTVDIYHPLFHTKLDQSLLGFAAMQTLSNKQSLEQESMYKKIFADRWQTLEINTQVYLLTAEKNYNEHKNDTDAYNFDGDNLIKSLELELRMKLFEEMRNDDIAYQIVAHLQSKEKPHKATIDYFNLASDELTLGTIYILLQQNTLVRSYIQNTFPALYAHIDMMVSHIDHLKNTYRNKSAHGSLVVTLTQFEEIQDILLYNQKILLLLIESI